MVHRIHDGQLYSYTEAEAREFLLQEGFELFPVASGGVTSPLLYLIDEHLKKKHYADLEAVPAVARMDEVTRINPQGTLRCQGTLHYFAIVGGKPLMVKDSYAGKAKQDRGFDPDKLFYHPDVLHLHELFPFFTGYEPDTLLVEETPTFLYDGTGSDDISRILHGMEQEGFGLPPAEREKRRWN